ncbi:MAG: LptF/LptG family permease [Flavobacteriaceae bacterium]|nr:LptF/LptG family permease [Flavobacteriaceae bacterium]
MLVMQILWQQFDKIAGRGLGVSIILKFLNYTTLMVLPTALSIGILLSSIMALGNLSENYEFAAIKSSGVSLYRMLRPLIILMLILSTLNFLFLNYVFPYATYESKNLVRNIKKKRPAMALIAGSFNSDIPDFSIKFSEKYGVENNLLKDVLIYDLRSKKYNNKVITAKYGEITTTPGSKYMTLVLKNGYYVEDINEKTLTLNNDKMPSVKSSFKEHQINFDISKLDKIDDKKTDQHYEMMSLNQLIDKVDKLEKPHKDNIINNTKRYYQRVKAKGLVKDTIDLSVYKSNILANFNSKNKLKILQNTKREVTQIGNLYKGLHKNFSWKKRQLNNYKIEYHKRIAFSFACLVLFLVGAPLGSLIRKGGFGVPMITAIIIFVIYFFIGVLAKGMAESGKISPFLGGWLSTIIMFPFGLFLMYKAINDKVGIDLGKIALNFAKLFVRKKESIPDISSN